MQSPPDPLQFQPTILDQFMMGAADLAGTLWMPLVMGGFFALGAKKLVPMLPINDNAKNRTLRIAGWVRNAFYYLIAFIIVVVVWYFWYAIRERNFYENL
ncbi:MAG: hypothetical protein ABWZ40_00885 [Caulobacterales bacterium]